MRRAGLLFIVSLLIVNSVRDFSVAAGPPISSMTGGNKHNMSSMNTSSLVLYKASANTSDQRGRQICIFCHTPHNANLQLALWNRRDPTRTFGHYSSASLVIDDPGVRATTQYGEPTGSARLCLSCHDGETALGAVASGSDILFPAEYSRVAMLNYSGHHPVSFVYDQTVVEILRQRRPDDQFVLPPTGDRVKLDSLKRMQCTSCHDPHQDWLNDNELVKPPFWVGPTHDSVCLACHRMTTNP